ncbi:MAG: hypothetical protein FOGNACKC_03441 [Anaerolineae bacterium]|nr:hypothetical protein [Anaerolineae bacterium]
MSVTHQIQHQRKIIQQFDALNEKRQQIETTAGAHHRSNTEAANAVLSRQSDIRSSAEQKAKIQQNAEQELARTALQQIRVEISEHLSKANRAEQDAQNALNQAELAERITFSLPTNPVATLNGNASKNLLYNVSQAVETSETLRANIAVWQQQRLKRTTPRQVVAAILIVVLLLAAIAILIGLQPCGWSDKLTGSPSACNFVLTGHDQTVTSITFSPNGQSIASGSVDGRVQLQRVDTRQLIGSFGGDSVKELAFSSDGQTLIALGQDATYFWRATDRALRRESKTYDAISPDGSLLVSQSPLLHLYQSSDSKLIYVISQVPDAKFENLTFSSDNKLLAATDSATIYVWRVKDGELLQTWKHKNNSRVGRLAFNPDGKVIASSADGEFYLWRISDGELLRTGYTRAGSINSLAFSSDGQLFATGLSDRTVQMWRTSDWMLLRTFTGHEANVSSLAFNRNDKILATASTKNVYLWQIEP